MSPRKSSRQRVSATAWTISGKRRSGSDDDEADCPLGWMEEEEGFILAASPDGPFIF